MADIAALTTVMVVVFAGAVLQGAVGVGLGILAAPILALLAPRFVPGPLLASAFLLSVLVVLRDRRELDLRGAGWALAGRVPGTLLALGLLTFLSGAWLEIALGILLVACVLLAMAKGELSVPPRRGWVVAAGFLSGTSGTAAGVGGPPVALVWSSLPARRLRSTLAAYFLVGTGFSMTLLLLSGRFGDGRALLGMLPATVLGFVVSHHVGHRLDPTAVQRVVLTLSGASSAGLLLRGILRLS